ncbi:MAG: BON domain-containing protein [Chloroflexi bacterium]|nr:BON domain-containing protein [Chloroflexota bacterium]
MAQSALHLEQEADRRTRERVRKVLWKHEPLRASDSSIQLQVERGIVRLSGRVRVQALKQIAAYLARSVEGVQGVQNDLVSDSEVVRAVADALAADPLTRPHVLRVDASLGQVRLAGIAPSLEVERRALEVARAVPLALDAVSAIEIDPQAASQPTVVSS